MKNYRDISKAIAQAKKRIPEGFYISDFKQVVRLSGVQTYNSYYWEVSNNALLAGFGIGYRTAIRDMRDKAKRQ